MSATGSTQSAPIEETLAPYTEFERVELVEREFDGVAVALHWTRGTDVLEVTVDDASGDNLELVVGENERPLDVFHHAVAYAHARGIELPGDGRRARVAVDV